MTAERVFVIGVGMTKFGRPRAKEWDYSDMATLALQHSPGLGGAEVVTMYEKGTV